ncbi:SDR family NAD(P)-dependent oxidoreductase [Arthrobacter sp. S39]|uniref:SDR family NAD(P)-dependent oxidoreductase n=1 Tax=Arthrobacter sp. S39 TaxID=2509720 RepID=UPI0010381A54|nr:SDR family NAD(P)-dependent oxidoreductase [Arthrobacter sp. S39]TAP39105.1 SDR family oxidoreductase [Arthrobacter sp. S39]
MESNLLTGRVALVTGAGEGIGRASVLALVQHGARVVGCDVDEDALAETDRMANDLRPGSSRCIRGDVTSPLDIGAAVAFAVAEFGKLDVVHANAGVSQPASPAGDIPLNLWRRVLEVNLTGLFVTFQAAVPELVKSGNASFIATASGLGVVGAPGLAAYVASKHAVLGFVKSAALDYAPRGLRVNAVAPGMTDTPMLSSSTTPEIRSDMTASIPAGRFGKPSEIANVVVWLASELSSYVVGATIVADGGDSID